MWQLDTVEGIFEPVANIAVNSVGSVLIQPDGIESSMLIMIDSSAAKVVRFGRFGEGPGELRRAGVLFSVEDTFFVVGPGRAVVSAWSSSGEFLSETPLAVGALTGLGVGLTHEALYLLKTDTRGGVSSLIRQERPGGDVDQVLDLTTGFAAAAALASGPSGLRWPPPFTPYHAGFVVGNGSTFQLVRYDVGGGELVHFGLNLPELHRGPVELARMRQRLAAGSTLPGPIKLAQQERLDTLDRESVPHFGRSGIQVDGSGRLWVLGSANDSTVAWVFSNDSLLGRLAVKCLTPRRGIAMNGHWLALRCAPRSEYGSPVLQLYRIVESGG